jgi:hypothetical protein
VTGKSVKPLFDSFRRKLNKDRKRYAPLQLVGRIEDFLVKEFVLHIFRQTHGEWFPLVNLGKSGEQKVDIAILEGNLRGCTSDTTEEKIRNKTCVRVLIEAKYIRNRSRICLGDAMDETGQTLKSLAKQLHRYERRKHGGFPVNLKYKAREIYGLVFASFVSLEEKNADERKFFEDIRKKAKDLRLRYFDLPGYAWLEECYSATPVKALNTTFYVSLRAGLWRRDTRY